jgi:hypothetical protein
MYIFCIFYVFRIVNLLFRQLKFRVRRGKYYLKAKRRLPATGVGEAVLPPLRGHLRVQIITP